MVASIHGNGFSVRGAARRGDKRWLAIGGIFGAVPLHAASSASLALAGISGAWIGTLTMLEPYRSYVATVTVG